VDSGFSIFIQDSARQSRLGRQFDVDVREPLTRFTRPFNTTLQPVAVVPVPVGGLPVGIQVAGRTNSETLRAAAWLEREWRG